MRVLWHLVLAVVIVHVAGLLLLVAGGALHG